MDSWILQGPQNGRCIASWILCSRYIVGFTIQTHESSAIASQLLEQIVKANDLNINTADIAIVHSDNGGPMTSENMQQTLASYNISQSLSRPSVLGDNAQRQSYHRVVKYHRLTDRHNLPKTIDEAMSLFSEIIDTYNTIDYHSGIGFYTPHMVYNDTAPTVAATRLAKKQAHYQQHPERYTKPPRIQLPPDAVTINQPKPQKLYTCE
ncbi:transposase family protein [Corynebacterium hindlerae]|uniref:Transposase family protein n=1 Tax=Corynebacterium hindlerae TaxID=699041 RepID=A0A7G5FHD4_9CORY|nr:DDE-type integrase/transposase/recombinase [Corynebacterium hindlerae]QMV86025.1 transposase family protein [Corynebacterium hindlerae]